MEATYRDENLMGLNLLRGSVRTLMLNSCTHRRKRKSTSERMGTRTLGAPMMKECIRVTSSEVCHFFGHAIPSAPLAFFSLGR